MQLRLTPPRDPPCRGGLKKMFDLQFFQTGQNNLLPNVVTTTLHGVTVGLDSNRLPNFKFIKLHQLKLFFKLVKFTQSFFLAISMSPDGLVSVAGSEKRRV